jgi:hypothetical protein
MADFDTLALCIININYRARIIHIPQSIALLPVVAAYHLSLTLHVPGHTASGLQSRTRLTPAARDSALGTSRLSLRPHHSLRESEP